jgi:hypothetical protein
MAELAGIEKVLHDLQLVPKLLPASPEGVSQRPATASTMTLNGLAMTDYGRERTQVKAMKSYKKVKRRQRAMQGRQA